MFYQGVPIDDWKNVTGTVAQYSAESEYNAAFTARIYLAYFRTLNNEVLNEYPDVVP